MIVHCKGLTSQSQYLTNIGTLLEVFLMNTILGPTIATLGVVYFLPPFCPNNNFNFRVPLANILEINFVVDISCKCCALKICHKDDCLEILVADSKRKTSPKPAL